MSEPKLESWFLENVDMLVRISLDDADLRQRIDTLLAQLPASEHAAFYRTLESECEKALRNHIYPEDAN